MSDQHLPPLTPPGGPGPASSPVSGRAPDPHVQPQSPYALSKLLGEELAATTQPRGAAEQMARMRERLRRQRKRERRQEAIDAAMQREVGAGQERPAWEERVRYAGPSMER